MHSKSIVITSINHGSSEWIMNRITGYTFSAGSTNSLLSSINDFLTDSSEEHELLRKNAYILASSILDFENNCKVMLESFKG